MQVDIWKYKKNWYVRALFSKPPAFKFKSKKLAVKKLNELKNKK